jgi:hypothetical protein
MKIRFEQNLECIASTENLLEAWREFLPGKKSKPDVQNFNLHLFDNLLSLKRDLVNGTYRHGGYRAFNISDPKPRNIHKACVRDRLLHHALYRVLYPFFDRTFIADSYSCRLEKGTYKAIERFDSFYRKASRNNTRTVWVLKCDIRKFFASIDHAVLMEILSEYIADKDIFEVLRNVVDSFYSTEPGVGLPLHPDKTFIITAASGVDFLGWVIFPDHKVLRTATKWRMIKRLEEIFAAETVSSYRGLLTHGNAHRLSEKYLRDTGLAVFQDWL